MNKKSREDDIEVAKKVLREKPSLGTDALLMLVPFLESYFSTEYADMLKNIQNGSRYIHGWLRTIEYSLELLVRAADTDDNVLRIFETFVKELVEFGWTSGSRKGLVRKVWIAVLSQSLATSCVK